MHAHFVRSRRFLPVLGCLPILLAGCSQMRGRMAPEIEAGSWLNLADGASFRLADHRGRAVLLEFWATW